MSAAQFTLQLDFSIVNVALATIQREFAVPAADLQWIVTGYALPFGALLLLGGRIGDLTGHRRLLGLGLALFGVTSLAAGLAPDAGVLIGARFAQGASAALVAPMALAAIADLFPDGPPRARALGIYQGATAAGASAGIVLGGILTEYAGWRAIFLVNPPVIALLVAAVLRLLPPGRAHGSPAGLRHAAPGGGVGSRLDLAGAVLVTVSAAALIFGLSEGQQRGFAAPVTLGALTAAVVLGAAFGPAERRAPEPMIPLAVLADRARKVALAAMFAVASVVVGYAYFVTPGQRAAGAAAYLVRHGAAVPHRCRARDRRRRAGGPGPGRRPARRLAAGRHGGRARGPGHRRRGQDPRRGRPVRRGPGQRLPAVLPRRRGRNGRALERPAPWPACSCCFPPPTRLKEITARSAKQNNPRFAVEIGKNLTQATRLGSEQCGRTGAPPADQVLSRPGRSARSVTGRCSDHIRAVITPND